MSSLTMVKTQKPASTPPSIGQRSDSLLRRKATFAPPEGASFDLMQHERGTTAAPSNETAGHNFAHISVFPAARATFQLKLKVSEPGDMYEQEADRVADQVMRMPEAEVRSQESGVGRGGSIIQTKPG